MKSPPFASLFSLGKLFAKFREGLNHGFRSRLLVARQTTVMPKLSMLQVNFSMEGG